MLGVKVYSSVKNDYASLQEAYTEGRLITTNTSLGKDLDELAMKIAGFEGQKKKKFSLFG
jgi:hypothetical protein